MPAEFDVIQQSPSPRTVESLAADLRRLGVEPGMLVITHTALSAFGWVSGGPVAVIQALMQAVTPAGTLVMPAHSGDYSDPALWANPPVPPDWIPQIYASMPAYDPRYTPTRGIGVIAELFRTFPGVLRSDHPALSFSAWGRQAEEITRGHAIDFSMGENSPLARLYERDGWVLLLGVGYGNNTSFHLAEYRVSSPPICRQGAPVMENGERVWKWYQDVDTDADLFEQLGADFEAVHPVRQSRVGNAPARLFRQKPAVDFAVDWIEKKRKAEQ